jgi:Ca-activated chloride channel family protein
VETGEWAKSGAEAIEKLRKAVSEAPSSRRKQIALIRGLIARGRFDEALTEAKRFSEADPDLADAHDLLAQAAAAAGDARLAVTEVDTQAELNARRAAPHLRAAKAFEALGDERRACAHWRSAAELTPSSDDALYEALRCRARVMGGRDAALAEARAIEKKGPKVEKLIEELTARDAPAFAPATLGAAFKASGECANAAERPPFVVVLPAGGAVLSPWTAGTAQIEQGSIVLPFVQDGMYRVLVAGLGSGSTCELTVRAHGSVKKIPVTGSDALAAVRTTTQTNMNWVSSPGCRNDFLY